ncbi:Uncharacterised protein g6120 [Pycnogonum litorale]
MQKFSTGLLCCLIVASVSVVVSASRGCISDETETYECDCDINGINYTAVSYTLYLPNCGDINSMSANLRTLHAKYSDTPLKVLIAEKATKRLPSNLFPKDINVMIAHFACSALTNIPDDLFTNQEDNIRDVTFETPSITAYPPTAINRLANLILFKVDYYDPDGQTLPNAHIKSFGELSSKLTDITFIIWNSRVIFDSDALANLTKLRAIDVIAWSLDNSRFADALPKAVHLRTLDLWLKAVTTFPTEMMEKIETRLFSVDSFSLIYDQQIDIARNDWLLLMSLTKFKKIDLSGIKVNCNCDMIPVAKANVDNKTINIIGNCDEPANLKGTAFNQLTMDNFQLVCNEN